MRLALVLLGITLVENKRRELKSILGKKRPAQAETLTFEVFLKKMSDFSAFCASHYFEVYYIIIDPL